MIPRRAQQRAQPRVVCLQPGTAARTAWPEPDTLHIPEEALAQTAFSTLRRLMDGEAVSAQAVPYQYRRAAV